jgi:Trk K+ transport system NAD-binding subunit
MDNKNKRPKKNYTLRQRFQYWFDTHMTKGAVGIILVFIAVTVLIAIFMGILIVNFNFIEEGKYGAAIWDSVATVINAEVPAFDDGSIGYLCLMTVSGVLGLLFTSVLIGTITSAIEVKLEQLRNGNSLVIEKGHTVVLGFYPGEYTLLRQLILAAAGKPACVVIAENLERAEMEEYIMDNLDAPPNFRFVCRTVDITDPVSIEKCSIDTCKTVIVSPTDDIRTVKAVLAAVQSLKKKNIPGVSVNAVMKGDYRFPPSIAIANNISTLPTNSIMAKMIAHSCTQSGLAETFKLIFDFEGSDFHLITLPGVSGLSFEEIMIRMENGVPAGVFRDEAVILNPPASFIIEEEDQILVFSEEQDSASLGNAQADPLPDLGAPVNQKENLSVTVIIGYNTTLPIILSELPENVSHVYLVNTDHDQYDREKLEEISSARNLSLTYYIGDPSSENVLLDLAYQVEHFVILNDHGHDSESDPDSESGSRQDADIDTMLTLLHLRDLRTRYHLNFNITVEMVNEHDQCLVDTDDHTDFLVSSNISSLILAQLSESPKLIDVFRELLTNEGNELYLKNAGQMRVTGKYSFRTLRRLMLNNRYILLGYLDADKHSFLNCPADEMITLTEDDELIVIGEC